MHISHPLLHHRAHPSNRVRIFAGVVPAAIHHQLHGQFWHIYQFTSTGIDPARYIATAGGHRLVDHLHEIPLQYYG